jgi:hypothetical protein
LHQGRPAQLLGVPSGSEQDVQAYTWPIALNQVGAPGSLQNGHFCSIASPYSCPPGHLYKWLTGGMYVGGQG